MDINNFDIDFNSLDGGDYSEMFTYGVNSWFADNEFIEEEEVIEDVES